MGSFQPCLAPTAGGAGGVRFQALCGAASRPMLPLPLAMRFVPVGELLLHLSLCRALRMTRARLRLLFASFT